jgi:hypothetical protein
MRCFSTFLRDLSNSCVSSTTCESGLRHPSEMVWDFVAGYSLVVVTSLLSSWRNLPSPKVPRTSACARNIHALEDVRDYSDNSMARAQAAKRSNSLLRSRILTAAACLPKAGGSKPDRRRTFGLQTLSGVASTSKMKVQVDFPRAAAVKSEWLHNGFIRRNGAHRNAFFEFEQERQSAANSPVCRERCNRESMFADHREPSAAPAQFDSQPGWQVDGQRSALGVEIAIAGLAAHQESPACTDL